MKYLVFICFFVSFLGNSQDLKSVRNQYPLAVENGEIVSKLNTELASVNSSSKPELLAYKGAVLTLRAKFAKKTKDKKEFFKEGVSLIESALSSAPNTIEMHYIRMSVQENSPKFLGYHKNIEEDKKFLLKNYDSTSSRELKQIVKEFVMKSENFDESEKTGFKK